jgi:hypothetical protein
VQRGAPPRRPRIGSPEPGDEQDGAWPRERLEAMDARFVERLERAIATGSERASAAQATVVDPTSRMR